MKNIASLDWKSDRASYKTIVAGTRKPQKPYLIDKLADVELAIESYENHITNGLAAPLGFDNEDHNYHYGLYDSKSEAVRNLKNTLFDQYNGHTCPYCQLDAVSHIDHFLPRAAFPEFSVSLQNLLMACDSCNSKYKLSNWGVGNDQVIFNPRYNVLAGLLYLKATAVYSMSAIVVKFSITPGLPMSALMQRHFDFMHLNDRYIAKVTTNEIPKISKLLNSEPTRLEKLNRLNSFIKDQLSVTTINSWEYAFYSALQPLTPAIVDTDCKDKGIP